MAAVDHLDPPLDMLAAWYRLVEQQFETMRQLASRQPVTTVGDAARQAGQAVISCLDESIALHHEVEQGVLFPELIESMAGSDPVCLREMIAGVTRDHRALASTWRRVRPGLGALAEGRPATLTPADVARLIEQCRCVFRREHDELLPMANRLLSDQARLRIADAMQARHRGRTA